MSNTSEVLAEVSAIHNTIDQLEADIARLKSIQTVKLNALREAVGSPSFKHEGRYYQIRSRGDSTYIVMSPTPLGRPRKQG